MPTPTARLYSLLAALPSCATHMSCTRAGRRSAEQQQRAQGRRAGKGERQGPGTGASAHQAVHHRPKQEQLQPVICQGTLPELSYSPCGCTLTRASSCGTLRQPPTNCAPTLPPLAPTPGRSQMVHHGANGQAPSICRSTYLLRAPLLLRNLPSHSTPPRTHPTLKPCLSMNS